MGLGIWRKHQFKAAQPFLELCIYKLTRDKIWRAQRDFLLGGDTVQYKMLHEAHVELR